MQVPRSARWSVRVSREPESDDNTQGPFVVMSLSALRINLAEAYEAPRDVPTPVYVELKLADILADMDSK
jgi:hypothetical protein